jgi:O-antigen ligase
MAVLAYVALPERRPVIRRFATVLLVVSVVYFPLEWNSTSTIAQPARAVRSAFDPSARDTLSNAYRQQEDTNLAAMIARYAPFGTGFGVQINYNVAPIVDISNVDSFIGYVPHNGVLYVWMRGGLPGELALWMFVAAALLLAIRATRARDPMVAVLGALVACATVAWVIQGYDDMGFYFFRIALAMGCLLGLLEAATRREARERQAALDERPAELSRVA